MTSEEIAKAREEFFSRPTPQPGEYIIYNGKERRIAWKSCNGPLYVFDDDSGSKFYLNKDGSYHGCCGVEFTNLKVVGKRLASFWFHEDGERHVVDNFNVRVWENDPKL